MTEYPAKHELYIALIAATGTPLEQVREHLKTKLNNVGYELIPIKLSEELARWKNISKDNEFDRIRGCMDAGDELRTLSKKKEAVALLGLTIILEKRKEKNDKGNAFLFDSLKTPEEVKSLKELYGPSFYAISIFSEIDKRSRNLRERLRGDDLDAKVAQLISRDNFDSSNKFGQNIRDAFPLSDLFVNVDQISNAKIQLERFIELIFGNTFRTPTKDEYCMYFAQGAAFRSADLGRQVGAVIASRDGQILAIGTNDVPVFGGGQFWDEVEGKEDPREWRKGNDWNDEQKKKILKDLLLKLTELKEDPLPSNSEKIDDLLTDLFSDNPKSALKGALLMDIIGFYRSVHAETAAIIDASRKGISIQGATMFVTAFPCHECARHILASGINSLRYIEPYPKSLAGHQYPDSIEVTMSGGGVADKLIFSPFVGIAPNRYALLFASNKRKNKDGSVVDWENVNPKILRYGRRIDFYSKVEEEWSQSLKRIVSSGGH